MSQIKEWGTVERLFVEAAVTVERKRANNRGVADDSTIVSDSSDQLLSVGFTGVPKSRCTRKKIEEEGKDIKITCKNCSTEFTHTIADQIRFASVLANGRIFLENARNAKIMNQQDLVLTLQLENVVAGIDASSHTTPKTI